MIRKNIALVGGYAVVDGTPDWNTPPSPETTPTILDASGNTRVITIEDGYVVSMQGLTIQNGYSATCGGGIFNGYSNLTLRDMTFTDNVANTRGGGLYNAGRASLEGTSIPLPPDYIDSCGKPVTSSGQVRLYDSNLNNNVASTGGGLYNDGRLTMIGVTLDNNTGESFGGGAVLDGLHRVLNSTFSNNRATLHGSAADVNSWQPGNYMVNTTITGNQQTVTNGNGDGGALHVFGPGNYDVINTTIVRNTGNIGARALFAFDTEIRLRNSVVTDSCGTEDGIIITNGNNALGRTGNALNCPVGVGDILLQGYVSDEIDPFLADNGGPTLTHLPDEYGVLINGGNVAFLPDDLEDLDGDGNTTEPLPVDQRGPGFVRNYAGGVDIGAVERAIDTAPTVLESNIVNISEVEPFIGEITVQFNERVNVSTAGAQLICNSQPISITGLPAVDVTELFLPVPQPLPTGANCQFAVFASAVTDVDVLDPPDNPAADYIVDFSVVSSPQCFVEYTGDGITDFYSNNHIALQLAVDAAEQDNVIRVAGTCKQSSATGVSMITVNKRIQIVGGYNATQSPINWTVVDPIQHPTILDANGSGRVLRIYGVIGGTTPYNAVTLQNLIIQNGNTDSFPIENGGGISISSANVNLINSIVRDNYSSGEGGGIHLYGTLRATNSTIVNNTAEWGGGIGVDGRAELVNTTVSGNEAIQNGGGITWDEDWRVSNSEFVAINSTIVNNINSGLRESAPSSSYSDENIQLFNTIVSGNTVNDCAGFSGYAGSNNVMGSGGDSRGCPSKDTDIVPQGGIETVVSLTLQNNGGFVPTYAVVPYGPAFNSGDPALLPQDIFDIDGDSNTTEPIVFDARGTGFARQVGPVDAGAFENSDEIAPYVWYSTPFNGQTNFRTGFPITLTFTERVNVVPAGVSVVCDGEPIPVTGLPATDVLEITIVEPLAIDSNVDCTLIVPATSVEDVDANDPPNQMLEDFTIAFQTSTPGCYVDVDGDNVTDFDSADHTALQAAHDSVASGSTLRVAGECRGAQVHQRSSGSTIPNEIMLEVNKSIIITGGWDVNNGDPIWDVPADPVAYP
ncbi:MAG: choice-of-anchor Q domain-containing protein, partial [Chloroflexota bacterium]